MFAPLAALLMLTASPAPKDGWDVDLGLGVLVLAQRHSGTEILGGAPVSVSLVHNEGRLWLNTGLTWMYATSAIGSDATPMSTQLFGLRCDAAVSALAFTYLDLKFSLGVGARFARISNWHNGHYDAPNRYYTSQRLLLSLRGEPAIRLHNASGSAALELHPLRFEAGYNLFLYNPGFSISRMF